MSVNFDTDGELVQPMHNWRRDIPPPKCFSNKAFLAERWEWYRKLEKEGFTDIEYFSRASGEALPLMDGMSHMDLQKNYLRFGSSKTTHYTAAEAHLSNVVDTYGKGSDQAKVWKEHITGFGSNTVSRKLSMDYLWVHRFTKRESARMWDLAEQEEEHDLE